MLEGDFYATRLTDLVSLKFGQDYCDSCLLLQLAEQAELGADRRAVVRMYFTFVDAGLARCTVTRENLCIMTSWGN